MATVPTGESLVTGPAVRVAGGFGYVDGPAWQPQENRLLVNDVVADTAYAWSDVGGLEVLRLPSNQAEGQVVDQIGRAVVCEHLTGAVVRVSPGGSREVLASHFDDHRLNGPRDVVIAPDGSLLFTDPTGARRSGALGSARPMQLGFCGVYRWTPDGEVSLLSSGLAEPAGLCLSIDQARLYVSDATTGEILEFKTSWGSRGMVLDEGRVFARTHDPEHDGADGLKLDALGNVWCASGSRIDVFDSRGAQVGSAEVPERVTNLAWGGVDGMDLYLTANSSLYRMRTAFAGAAWV